ncbi:MAG: class IV adenylate cyclase [Thermoanaerobaculales bacterium]
MTQASLETELKIPVADLEPIRQALHDVNADRLHPMMRETNVLLDTASGQLQADGKTLRLRRYGAYEILTLKGPVTYHGSVKEREEFEVEVSDLGGMARILGAIGFLPTIRYEKDRETWRFEEVTVVLDHTPMGDFVEVEGPPEQLPGAARKVGLNPDHAVRESYLGLWRVHRQRFPERHLPPDMVFEE